MVVQSVSSQVLLKAAQEIFETMVFMDIQPSDKASVQFGNDSLLGTNGVNK